MLLQAVNGYEMRLGGHIFGCRDAGGLEPLCEKLDTYGLSTVPAAFGIGDMSQEECAAFGEKARELGLVVGEVGYWQNLMTPDEAVRRERIETVRALLAKADAMGCHCVVTLVGTRDPSDSALAPHPYMSTDECRSEFREVVLRILDGLPWHNELEVTKYAVEPWHNTFFYQPEAIREFLDSVDHPRFGLHLDQMNLVDQAHFYDTTSLIERTFELLADRVAAVHLKDVRCDPSHLFLKWDEVLIGEGVMDYETYLRRLGGLPLETPCFCEHLSGEREYAVNFERLHRLAEEAGVRFLRRGEKSPS